MNSSHAEADARPKVVVGALGVLLAASLVSSMFMLADAEARRRAFLQLTTFYRKMRVTLEMTPRGVTKDPYYRVYIDAMLRC